MDERDLNRGTDGLPMFERMPVPHEDKSAEALADLRAVAEAIPPHHRDGPWTERQAALEAADRAPTQRTRVLAFLVARGERGATDWEGADQLGMLRTSYGARRNTLMRIGLIEDSGETRDGPYGNANIVWTANDRARRAWNAGE